jgi:hypothetical protein
MDKEKIGKVKRKVNEKIETVLMEFPGYTQKFSIKYIVLWSEFLATERRCVVFPVRYELNLYMLCRRK